MVNELSISLPYYLQVVKLCVQVPIYLFLYILCIIKIILLITSRCVFLSHTVTLTPTTFKLITLLYRLSSYFSYLCFMHNKLVHINEKKIYAWQAFA